jgi:hypothetical protein
MLNVNSKPVIDDLVRKLNDQFNFPILSEESEAKGINWLVTKVAPHVPEWALVAMATVADGVTREELETLKTVLVGEINKLVDIPGAPEMLEARLIGFVVDGLLEYALEGHVLPQ